VPPLSDPAVQLVSYSVVPKGYPLTECRHCHEPITERDELSVRGLHPDCAEERIRDNARQLVAHNGPYFEHWRERCRAAFNDPRLAEPRPI
jgi:hypothetical protein